MEIIYKKTIALIGVKTVYTLIGDMKYCAEPPKIITNMKSFEQRSSDETVYVGSNVKI